MEKGNGENQSKREEIMGNRHTKNGDTEYGIRNMENGIWRWWDAVCCGATVSAGLPLAAWPALAGCFSAVRRLVALAVARACLWQVRRRCWGGWIACVCVGWRRCKALPLPWSRIRNRHTEVQAQGTVTGWKIRVCGSREMQDVPHALFQEPLVPGLQPYQIVGEPQLWGVQEYLGRRRDNGMSLPLKVRHGPHTAISHLIALAPSPVFLERQEKS